MTEDEIINEVSKLIAEETLDDTDPVKKQDQQNEDEAFKTIEELQRLREKQANLFRWPGY